MKNVIVGIDFSECSLNAMRHAVSLANAFKANLTLLFVISSDTKVIIGMDETMQSNIISLIEPKLKVLIKECERILKRGTIRYKIRIGKTSRELAAEAKEQGDAFIVIGTHGCSGVEEFFIGSSAFKTIQYSEYPTLSIRGGVNINTNLTDILLPIDDTHETLQKLPIAASLAQAFQAKIHLLGLYRGNYKEIKTLVSSNIRQAEVYFVEKNIRVESDIVRTHPNKLDTMLSCAQKKNINLIILMKEVELDGENVLNLTPFSERVVNRSTIPVLALNVNNDC
jgi:nucleotide-binding universal stress UspA family protein